MFVDLAPLASYSCKLEQHDQLIDQQFSLLQKVKKAESWLQLKLVQIWML